MAYPVDILPGRVWTVTYSNRLYWDANLSTLIFFFILILMIFIAMRVLSYVPMNNLFLQVVNQRR